MLRTGYSFFQRLMYVEFGKVAYACAAGAAQPGGMIADVSRVAVCSSIAGPRFSGLR